ALVVVLELRAIRCFQQSLYNVGFSANPVLVVRRCAWHPEIDERAVPEPYAAGNPQVLRYRAVADRHGEGKGHVFIELGEDEVPLLLADGFDVLGNGHCFLRHWLPSA